MGNKTSETSDVGAIEPHQWSDSQGRESFDRAYIEVFEHSPAGLCQLSLDGCFIRVNQSLCRILGYCRNELEGETLGSFGTGAADSPSFHMSGVVVKTFRRKDGSKFPGRLRTTPVLNAKGRPIYFVGSLSDTSDERLTKDRLVRKNRLNEILLDAVPGAAMLVRRDLQVLAANRIACELGADLGRTCCDGFRVCGAVQEGCPGLRALDTGERVSAEMNVGGRWYEVDWIPLDSDVFLQYANDITERRTLQWRVAESKRMEAIGTLAGGVAHDFNNILAAVVGNAELAKIKVARGGYVAEKLDMIISSSQRAAELAGQLLVFAGKGFMRVETFDIRDVIRGLNRLARSAVPKGIELSFVLGDEALAVSGDKAQISQAIMSLITNSAEAFGTKSGSITVAVFSRELDEAYLAQTAYSPTSSLKSPPRAGSYVCVQVTDDGTGMPEEIRARIFDPFFTTKFFGRGMGLAATLGVVSGHQGALRVNSEPGRGTEFKIWLPAIEPERISGISLEQGAKNEHELWCGSGLVLLVDDEEMVRGAGRDLLELIGFEVLEAADGRQAIELFQQRADDVLLVILDLTMPVLDGQECFEQLRLIRPDVKVLLCSGYSMAQATAGFAGKGLSGFLSKPFSLDEMRDRIRRILERDSGLHGSGRVGGKL